MLEQIELTEEEKELLLGHFKKSGTHLIRQRTHAILLFARQYPIAEIAEVLFADEGSVRQWIKRFLEVRIASIFPEYKGNTNASKLTLAQREEIAKTLQSPPSEAGLPGSFWSVAGLKQYLCAEYGVIYESARSYHHLLAIHGYSFKLPEGFDKKRDETLIKSRMQEIKEQIATLRREDYHIFAADECSVCFETEYRRAWLARGQKTLLRVNRQKVRQHYFGALSLETGREELIRLDWQNTDTIIGALRELLKRYPDQKLCLIWDNARWHRGKALRDLLGKGNEFERLHLLWLPPYAPDKNPQEKVWRIGKDAIGNQCMNSFDEVRTLFESNIADRIFNYSI